MDRTKRALSRARDRLRSDQRGLELLEYAVLATVLALALAAAYILLGSQITSALARLGSSLGTRSGAQSLPAAPRGRVEGSAGGADRIGVDPSVSVGGGAAVEPRPPASRGEPPEERETEDEPTELQPEREESGRDGESDEEDREHDASRAP